MEDSETSNNIFSNTEYRIIDNCLYKEIHKKDNVSTKKLANFVPYAKSELLLDDGIEPKRYLTIGGIHCTGKYLPDIRIPSNEFNKLNWITQYWGLQCNIEIGQMVKDCIRHAIQCTADDITTNHIYTHTGWQEINGKFIFLCNGLYLDEGIETNIELAGKLSRYSLVDPTERFLNTDEKCIHKLLSKEFIPHRILFPLIAMAFLSPLNHFLKMVNCEPKVILFLIGKTGARKSTLASLILSFFGDFTNTDLPISFRDTANSIIEQTFILKDVLTVIDDYHPSTKADEQSMNKTAQIIMRSYGDRIGRNKLNCDSTLKISKPPSGNAILTGESAPDISESGTARYIVVELSKDDINIEKLTELQEFARNGCFKSIMSLYIRNIYLYVNEDYTRKLFLEKLRTHFIEYRAMIQNKLDDNAVTVHPRIPESLTWLWLGFEKFIDFLLINKMISQKDYDDLLSEFLEIAIDLAISQSKAITEDNPSIKFLTKLNSLLESKSVIVENKSNYQFAGGNNFIGYEDDMYYYLIPDMAHKAVKKLCDEQDELFAVSKKTLLKHLSDDGYIEVSNNSKTKELRLGDKVKRFIWLKKDKFNSVIQ